MKTHGLAVASVLAIAGSAFAGQIMSQTIPFGPSTPNFDATLTFDKYSGPSSDIVSIKVIVELAINGGRLELDNDGEESAAGAANLGATAAISSPDVPLLNDVFQPVVSDASAANNAAFLIGSNDGDADGSFETGGDDYFLFQGTAASDMQMGFINGAFFGAYSGGGTFNIEVDANQIFDYGAIGGISFSGSPVTAAGTVTIIYNIIPTPGTAALGALAGLAALRRRRA
ncbi:MAG: hypothetical protein SFZ24_05370 [Planctomycetota bacterium]|nr:hypothetical protein [Planctomycetota bacterium]